MLTYILFKTQSMLLSATGRKSQPDADLHPVQDPEHDLVSNKQEGQPDADLHPVQNPEHDLVRNKREGLARCWLTSCSKPRAYSCQQQAGRASQMLTYSLFKSQTMQLLATSRKGQPDADLHSVKNPEHALVSNKQEDPARCWLTSCSKPRACPCQQQAGRASQMLTHILFKTQSMPLSATSRKGQPDPDLHPVQNPEHAVFSNKQEGPARSWLTSCSKPRACSCQKQAGRASQILTYKLFKTQSMLLSTTSRKGQPDADLHPVQNPEHDLINNKQEGPARCWLTFCLKPRACSCQQQAGSSSQMLTYRLFKTQSMPLSATSRKGQPDPDLHSVQNPEHALVSNKQKGPARSWLTSCSKPRACLCQQQAGRASQILTYILLKTQRMPLSATSRKGHLDADLQPVQNPEHTVVSNKQEGPARSWLTSCIKPRACPYQQQARRASQILTYKLFKAQSMPLSATSKKGQPDPDLHAVGNPEHPLVSNKQEGPARSWLTPCWKPRAYSCQQQAGRTSQSLTYTLFKTHSILVSNKQKGPARCWLTPCSKPRVFLSATSRKGQPDADLHPVQNPEHAVVSNN